MQKKLLKLLHVDIHSIEDCIRRWAEKSRTCPICRGQFGGRKKRRRKRRRIGTNKKKLKRLHTQYRRFRIAKGDKRFKGTKGLVKWSRPSKSKRKGKKRSRRIYHRKRRKTIRKIKSKSRKRKHTRKH